MAVKFGVMVPQGWHRDLEEIEGPVNQYEHMTKFAQEAEKLGFDSIWLYDHVHTVPTGELETTFECWMCTAALARDTSTIRIGQLVTCNSYRPPALLAKMASTVDVLSHGRLDFGIGAGWYDEEYKAYGYPFPDGPERLKMLREALQVFHAMWNEPRATFEGKYYRLDGAINEPKGVQKPHIPIWVGGGGEKVTLKLVAQYADACNIGGTDPEVYRHKFDVLKQHCEDVGRDYSDIIRSAEVFTTVLEPGQDPVKVTVKARRDVSKLAGHEVGLEEFQRGLYRGYPSNYVGSPQGAIELYNRLIDAGVQYIIVYLNEPWRLDSLRLFAQEVLPAFRS